MSDKWILGPDDSDDDSEEEEERLDWTDVNIIRPPYKPGTPDQKCIDYDCTDPEDETNTDLWHVDRSEVMDGLSGLVTYPSGLNCQQCNEHMPYGVSWAIVRDHKANLGVGRSGRTVLVLTTSQSVQLVRC